MNNSVVQHPRLVSAQNRMRESVWGLKKKIIALPATDRDTVNLLIRVDKFHGSLICRSLAENQDMLEAFEKEYKELAKKLEHSSSQWLTALSYDYGSPPYIEEKSMIKDELSFNIKTSDRTTRLARLFCILQDDVATAQSILANQLPEAMDILRASNHVKTSSGEPTVQHRAVRAIQSKEIIPWICGAHKELVETAASILYKGGAIDWTAVVKLEARGIDVYRDDESNLVVMICGICLCVTQEGKWHVK
tara:strand:- start:460 stop:1206 length:747 start_codon:yes stop_codon:yes gene_type:complete